MCGRRNAPSPPSPPVFRPRCTLATRGGEEGERAKELVGAPRGRDGCGSHGLSWQPKAGLWAKHPPPPAVHHTWLSAPRVDGGVGGTCPTLAPSLLLFWLPRFSPDCLPSLCPFLPSALWPLCLPRSLGHLFGLLSLTEEPKGVSELVASQGLWNRGTDGVTRLLTARVLPSNVPLPDFSGTPWNLS